MLYPCVCDVSPCKVRGVLVHPHPESDDAGWDSQVEATRTMMAR